MKDLEQIDIVKNIPSSISEEALASVSSKGLPPGPGLSGSDRYTPQDALRDGTLNMVPGANEIICLKGCKYYSVFFTMEDSADPWEWKQMHRVCRKYHDDEGEMSMTDTSICNCSCFTPEWWNLKGWIWWLKNKIQIRNFEQHILSGKGKQIDD